MRKAAKFKLQDQSNTLKIGNMLDDMWQIHLHILLLTRRYYRMFGKNLSASRLNAHVAKLKKRTKPHWKALPSQVVQDVVLRYSKSQDAFFQNIEDRKAGLTTRKVGRPKIKPRQKYNSMTFTQAGYTLESAGFDYGNKTFLTNDTGDKIESPQFFKQSLNKLRSLNKALSRKVKGSGNWYRACRTLARQHRKVARQREDWQWKLAADLCRKFDILCFETLNLDGMKRLWGRKVSDHAFYQFLHILKQKCWLKIHKQNKHENRQKSDRPHREYANNSPERAAR